MKVQACIYKSNKSAKWKEGIAFLQDFDMCDVEFIVSKTGHKLDHSPYQYKLRRGPLQYIDTEYYTGEL